MFKKATVDAASVPSTQSNFPTYIDLSRLGITTLAEAQSVRVYADEAKTTEWAREIVSVTEMHVKVPSLTSTIDIYIDADGIRADYAAGATYGRNAVWSSGYVGVWHLESLTAESTATGATLTNNNSVATTTGKIADGADFGASNTNKTLTTSNTLGLAANAARSFSTWVNIPNAAGSGVIWDIFGMGYNTTDIFYIFEYREDGGVRKLWTGRARNGIDDPTIRYAITFTTNTWYKLDYTIDASRNQVLYVNGVNVGSNTAASGNGAGTTLEGVAFARNFYSSAAARLFSGKMDNTKVYNDVLSANWITTEYNNQNAESTFWGTWADVGGGGSPAQAARRGAVMMG